MCQLSTGYTLILAPNDLKGKSHHNCSQTSCPYQTWGNMQLGARNNAEDIIVDPECKQRNEHELYLHPNKCLHSRTQQHKSIDHTSRPSLQ